MPTIREVADLAGVAVGTVSHVITGSVPVSESLRRKVQAAIRELDYHPNHVARSLKTSRTKTLGIMVPDVTVSFYPQIIRGAESAARKRQYSLIAVNSDESAARQKELLSLLRSQRVEGILLVIASTQTPLTQISRLIESGIPVVCLDRIPDRVAVDSVSVEDQAAAELGINHLIELGHRRIAVATGPLSLKNERQRLQGCQDAISRAGLHFDDDFIWHGNLRPEDVAAMARERLRDPATWPDAIFATNGPTGLGILRALHDCGMKTPRDIGFVTFDELTLDDVFEPAVTTVVQPAYDIGFRAAEILLDKVGDRNHRKQCITLKLPAALKIRDSSRLPGRLRGAPAFRESA